MPELPRDGLRGGAVVAGEHHHANAVGGQRPQRVRRRRFDRIGDGNDAGEPCRRQRGKPRSHRRHAGARLRVRARRVSMLISPRNLALPIASRLSLDDAESRLCRRARQSREPAAIRVSARPQQRRWQPPEDAHCHARCSRQAAALRASSKPDAGATATTFGLPSVSVPVLSMTSVSIFSIRSSASAFLISTPACAPRPTPTMIDIGVARPSAQGQAMISTLTAATRP